MRIQYTGPFESVIVPDLGREVARGDVVELGTADEVAVGKRLLEQGDAWSLVKPEKPAKPGKAPSEAPAETEG